MAKGLHILFSNRKTVIMAAACLLVCLGLIIIFTNFISKDEKTTLSKQNSDYTILAANNLGMHCYQDDYSSFLILPPGNTLKVQVFLKEGDEARLVNSGINVSYKIKDNTSSADKINFWDYAKDYGYDVPPNIGITGNGLSGKMELSKDGNYYEVTAIPLTPYNDGSKELNPYQMAIITVYDSTTGKKLATIDNLVAPVSNEMDCGICHGNTNTDLNILKAHDELSKTSLVADLANGKRYKCSECHKDNILNSEGKQNILPLSQAMHSFHSDKMSESKVKPECYSCHPGPVSQCYRGAMYAAGVSCVNSKCHGDMKNIAKTQKEGRQAWLEEPNCSNCHGDKYAVNSGKLYRNSYLQNNINDEMNGFILCESCHNSSHAEWKSSNPKDNLLPTSLLGYPNFIDKCTVCHEGKGTIHETSQTR